MPLPYIVEGHGTLFLILAGLEKLRFHDLRHTSATRMVESGVNIVTVSKILGHADLKTTMRYAHPDKSVIDAVNALATYYPNHYKQDSGNK